MIEDVPLTSQDVDTMLQNLMADGFTGYVRNVVGNSEGFFFFVEGELRRAVLRTKQGESKVMQQGRLLAALQEYDQVPTSSFVVSNRICDILSRFFTFKHYYKDYQVKRKELKKVLTNLEQDQFSGVLQFETQDGPVCVVLDRGEPINDQFAKNYGQILCGREAITNLFEHVHSNGSTMQVYAEKNAEIETKVKKIDEELSNMRTLKVKPSTGMLGINKDQVRVDEDLARDWQIDPKSTFMVMIELDNGKRYERKCTTKRGRGDLIDVGKNLCEFMKDGQEVLVFPA
jgi:hypothetical protein